MRKSSTSLLRIVSFWGESGVDGSGVTVAPGKLGCLLIKLLIVVSKCVLVAKNKDSSPRIFGCTVFSFHEVITTPLIVVLNVVVRVITIVNIFGSNPGSGRR